MKHTTVCKQCLIKEILEKLPKENKELVLTKLWLTENDKLTGESKEPTLADAYNQAIQEVKKLLEEL